MIDREILEYPRPFRIRKELDCSSEFIGIVYGVVDQENRDLIDFSGMFTFNTGHVICFDMKLPENFPSEGPEIFFSKEYKNFVYNEGTENEDNIEMNQYVKDLLKVTDDDLKLNADLIIWDSNLFIGEWLMNIKKVVFKK